MMRAVSFAGLLLVSILMLLPTDCCLAGMPSVLPTNWTAESGPPSWTHQGSGRFSGETHVQAISFFLACLLLSAWCIQKLWNSVRYDFPSLPQLAYGRSVSLVLLWGLCFVIVLAMISGARELMTPGAWRKQGWTYTLSDPKPSNRVDDRRQALERLRFALWQYAALHDGRFPAETDAAVDSELWQIPGWAGMRFLYAADRSVDEAGRLLAFEPAFNDDERLVLLTNGFVGWMRTAEIERQLSGLTSP